jgi:hypothetical protein
MPNSINTPATSSGGNQIAPLTPPRQRAAGLTKVLVEAAKAMISCEKSVQRWTWPTGVQTVQIGFNNTVPYRGIDFHIQTEDRGLKSADIESHIMHGGAILDSLITSYRELLCDDQEKQTQAILKRMATAHKALYRKLRAGAYDDDFGLSQVSQVASLDEDVDKFKPGQDRVPDEARRIEAGDSEGILLPDHGEAIALSDIKNVDFKNAATEGDDHTPADHAGLQAHAPPAKGVALSQNVRSWRGCREPAVDLSIAGLVEELLGI